MKNLPTLSRISTHSDGLFYPPFCSFAVMLLGAHIGISGGIENAPFTARSIGCEVMQIFSKNQRQWKVPPLAEETARAFRVNMVKAGIKAVGVHASYLINLGTSDPGLMRKSREALTEELRRAEAIGAIGVILHPGAHVGAGTAQGIENIAAGAQEALAATSGAKVRILFENAAGAGSTMGQSLEELSEIGRRSEFEKRVGYCIDTCHLYASGIDYTSEAGYGRLVDSVRDTLGLEKVRFFHLNDALFPLGSRKDRHANIGEGTLGKEGFRRLLNDRNFQATPGVLETPISDDKDHPYRSYEKDLETLHSLVRTGR